MQKVYAAYDRGTGELICMFDTLRELSNFFGLSIQTMSHNLKSDKTGLMKRCRRSYRVESFFVEEEGKPENMNGSEQEETDEEFLRGLC